MFAETNSETNKAAKQYTANLFSRKDALTGKFGKQVNRRSRLIIIPRFL